MSKSRFETLLDRYQNGDVSSADLGELDRLLRSDPTFRTLFVEQVLLQAHLHKACQAVNAAKPAAMSWRRRMGWTAGLAAAAMLLLALGMGLVSWMNPAPASEVASGLVRINGVAVTRIPNGARFEAAGKTPVVVRLADGSRAEFQPASQGTIRGRGIELAEGTGTFQVSHGGGQFRVNTPVGTVTALGTEFTVKLQPKKKKSSSKGLLAMAVVVTEGSVQVEAGGKSYVLAVGDNRQFNDDGEQNNTDDGDQNNNNKDDGEQDNNDDHNNQNTSGNQGRRR